MLRIEDFSSPQIEVAAKGRGLYDVIFVFSTKYQPPHPMLENWEWWRRIKEKFFGYHRDLLPEDVAQRLGGTIAYHDERNGQWVAVIATNVTSTRNPSGYAVVESHPNVATNATLGSGTGLHQACINGRNASSPLPKLFSPLPAVAHRAPPGLVEPRTPCRCNRWSLR